MQACCDSWLIRIDNMPWLLLLLLLFVAAYDDEPKGISQSQSSPIDRHAERQLQIVNRKKKKKCFSIIVVLVENPKMCFSYFYFGFLA